MRLQATLVLFSTFLVFAVAGIPCNCGLGPGYSIHETAETKLCHASDHKLVIRPDPYVSPAVQEKQQSNAGLHKTERIIRGGSVYPPQKDYISLCSCANTFVTPAKVPAPPCRKCEHIEGVVDSATLGHSSSFDSVSGSYHYNHHNHHHNHHRHHDKLSHVPADPVSIAIAVKQHLQTQSIPRNSVADRDLAFGFQKLPVEVSQECKHKIHEGNLNTISGQVLELKLPRAPITRTVDEEAYEDLLAQQEDSLEDPGAHEFKKPSLSDLGFINARASEQRFVNLKVENKQTCGVANEVSQCADGFRPGKVVLKQQVKSPNYVLKERETVCLGEGHQHHHHHHKTHHLWANGHSNIIKHIGGRCSSGCSACHSGCHHTYH